MPRIRFLKLLYASAGLLWAGYMSVRLVAYHLTEHVPMSSGTVYCLLLFVSIPAFGYVLLFKLFPMASQLLRR
jgi:hypothetical protein